MIEPDLESRQSNLNNLWSYIKSLRKDNTGLAPLKDKGRLCNAAVDKANILNRQYQSVFTQEEPGKAPCPDGLSYPDMNEFTVTTSEIHKLIQHLNPWKAAGPDNLSACFRKECAIELAPILAVIFNKSLSQGIVPEDWRHAHVTAIFKKGARQDPPNYRPVSLTSIC